MSYLPATHSAVLDMVFWFLIWCVGSGAVALFVKGVIEWYSGREKFDDR